MIENANIANLSNVVFKLAALPKASIRATLLARGFQTSSLDDAIDAVVAVGIPVDAVDAVNFVFRPKFDEPHYPIGRFGDGTHPVFYSAMEIATCIEEVRHHCRVALGALQTGQFPFPRYYTLIGCTFNGQALLLQGLETAHPDLISETESGYPFCQAVTRWARSRGADALSTMSARRQGGTCVPIFVRECITNAEQLERYRFVAANGEVRSEKLNP